MKFLFSSAAASLALFISPTTMNDPAAQAEQTEAVESENKILASDAMQDKLGPNIFKHLDRINSKRTTLLLNISELSENEAITPQDLKDYLIERDVYSANITDLHLNELADSINSNAMAAQKIVDPNTNETQLCIVSTGVLGRSLSNHISELSAIPEILIETTQDVGTSENWQSAKLLHEFAHCAQPYKRHTMFDYKDILSIEIDADQTMFNLFSADGHRINKFLKAYRAARAIASVHYTHITHHTNPALTLIGENRPNETISAEIIFNQSNTIVQELREEVSYLTTRNDLLIKALQEQFKHNQTWNIKDSFLENNPSVLQDAKNMRPADFFEKYDPVNSRFTSGIKKNLAELIKSERSSYETYQIYYNAAKTLLRKDTFASNPYAERFLLQYIDGIELYMPSVAECCQIKTNTRLRAQIQAF